jgi:hypothetical protein
MFAAIRHFSILRIFALLTTIGLGLAACGGGGSGGAPLQVGTQPTPSSSSCNLSDPATASECGTVLVAVTDAEGDFTTYTVDLLSISLERANGSRVETLPESTRIDFAELTELSELLSAATLAPGDIVGGRIRIDYTNAEIFVEAGGDIVAAQVVDTLGSPLGIIDVDIKLDDQEHLIVTRGRVALLSIDFDLAASHTVDTSTVPATAIAMPYLVAEVMPVDEKELRVRGALVGVDTVNGTYDVRVRPWHRRVGDHGVLTVNTTATTEFEIDGSGFVGQAGIDALALQPTGTLTVAFGTLNLGNRSFTASIVNAGDSVGGQQFSAIHGNIVSRTGDRLIVKGAMAVRRDRPTHFHRTVIVEVGINTGVSRVGDAGQSFDKDDLSVGQRIVAFGQFSNPSVDNSNPLGPDLALILDATEGRVRMLRTHLHGKVNSYVPGQVNLTLRGIDRLGIAMFDFSGTGGSTADDADPNDYEVATSTLALDALEVDRPIRVIGFVNRFGTAPPDFTGRTIVGPRSLRSALGIGWKTLGTGAPFQAMGSTSLVLDLANPDIGERHHMLTGRTLVDLFDLPGSPNINPGQGRSVYGIWEPGHVELFKEFSEFVDEVALRLGEADKARSMAAYGSYDEAANTLTTNHIVVHMLPAQ